jgi:hypothetical protein
VCIVNAQSMSDDATNTTKAPIKRVTIVLPEDIHEAGKDLARAEHRDFSGQVAALIDAAIKRKKEGEVVA